MSRYTRSILSSAASASLYANKEGEGAGGGTDDKPAEKPKLQDQKPAPGKAKDQEQPTKLELTQEELDARVTAAVKAAEAKIAKERDAEKAARDADEAKKRGEFEKLYQTEAEGRKKDQAERDALKLDLRKTQVHGRLRDFIAEHNPDYSAAAKYIAPLLSIAADTTDADADKQVKAAVEQYVKDNPRARVMGPGPSPQHKLPAGEKAPLPSQGQAQQRTRFTGPAARF